MQDRGQEATGARVIGRRGLLLGGGLAAAAGPDGGIVATVRLRPGGGSQVVTLRAEGAHGSRLMLGDAGAMLLPGVPDRVAALPLAGRQVVAAGVALPSGQVLAVLAGWDGVQGRILAVESWDWRGSGPRRLALRMAAVPDDRRVQLLYEAMLASPREDGPGPGGAPRVVVRHEAWRDILAWQDGGALRSEPLRPVLAGTWQARMAGTRAAVAGMLAAPCREVTAEALAATGLLDPLGRVAP